MKQLLLKLIHWYQCSLSPMHGPCCHYIPTCSEYARQAIEKYGAFKGGWLAVRRICRCHPFTRRDFYDPVP